MKQLVNSGKFEDMRYQGPVRPSRKLQKVADEDLLELFSKLKNNWYVVEDLAKMIGDWIPINLDNPKRSPIGSGYLKRLTKMTNEKWRQKTGFTPDGKKLVKIYTAGRPKS